MHATRVAAPLPQTGITGTPPESLPCKPNHGPEKRNTPNDLLAQVSGVPPTRRKYEAIGFTPLRRIRGEKGFRLPLPAARLPVCSPLPLPIGLRLLGLCPFATPPLCAP
jgi:hypothetical protein